MPEYDFSRLFCLVGCRGLFCACYRPLSSCSLHSHVELGRVAFCLDRFPGFTELKHCLATPIIISGLFTCCSLALLVLLLLEIPCTRQYWGSWENSGSGDPFKNNNTKTSSHFHVKSSLVSLPPSTINEGLALYYDPTKPEFWYTSRSEMKYKYQNFNSLPQFLYTCLAM